MIRFTLLVVLRSILLFAVVFGLFRLARKVITSFLEGLRGPRPEQPLRGTTQPPPARIEYHDVQDATFHEERKAP